MRYLFGFMCVLALGIMGCADTAGTGGSGGSAGSGGAAGTGGMAGSGGAGGLAGSGGTVGNNPPVIDYVEWEYGLDCTGFGDTTIQVTVSAKDADDPTGETLTYSGVVDYCGDISITSTPSPVTQTLDCELFSGLTLLNVTVKDPQDNEDTIGATFESATCEAGCVENDEGEVGCP